jgi:hypothetical protein
MANGLVQEESIAAKIILLLGRRDALAHLPDSLREIPVRYPADLLNGLSCGGHERMVGVLFVEFHPIQQAALDVEQPTQVFLVKDVGIHIHSVMLGTSVTHVDSQVNSVVSFVGRHCCSKQKEKAVTLMM